MSCRIRPDSIGRIHSGPAVSALPVDGMQSTIGAWSGDCMQSTWISVASWQDQRPSGVGPAAGAPVASGSQRPDRMPSGKRKCAGPPCGRRPAHRRRNSRQASEPARRRQPNSPRRERNPSGAATRLTSPRAEPTGSSGPAYLTRSGTHREQQSGSPHREQTRQEQQSGSFHRERTQQEKAAQLTSPRAKSIGSSGPTHLTASAPAGNRSPSHRPISAPARVAPEVMPSCRGAPKCLPGTRTCVASDAPLKSWKRLASAGKHA